MSCTSLLSVGDVTVSSATHGSLVYHKLDILALRVKSAIDKGLCGVVGRSVIALGDELSDVLGGRGTGQEGLWEVLGDLAAMI